MTKARTRTSRFPQHIREDAFAYYYAGFTRAEIMIHAIRKGSRTASASRQAVEAEQEAAQGAAK